MRWHPCRANPCKPYRFCRVCHMDRGKTFSERVLLGLMLAAVMALAVPVLVAGVTAAADAASPAKSKKHKKKKRARTRTGIKTRTVTKTVTVTSAAPSSGQMIGTFKLAPGSYSGGAAHGSWFRMILPAGKADSGPYFTNPNSTAGDRNYTLLSPGTDGGLNTGSFQGPPTPAFDDNGNALAARIIKPQRFAGVDFSVSTAPKEAQTNTDVPAPVVTADADGKLTGDLRAFTAEWNRQYFNQGSPKPDGTKPGLTSAVSGKFDATTRAYTLDWTSSIVGGPFNGFIGQWHLEGTFVSCTS